MLEWPGAQIEPKTTVEIQRTAGPIHGWPLQSGGFEAALHNARRLINEQRSSGNPDVIELALLWEMFEALADLVRTIDAREVESYA